MADLVPRDLPARPAYVGEFSRVRATTPQAPAPAPVGGGAEPWAVDLPALSPAASAALARPQGAATAIVGALPSRGADAAGPISGGFPLALAPAPLASPAAEPAKPQGFFARILAFLKGLFAPAPAPQPPLTGPSPVQPQPGPTAPAGGIQAYFTNTYTGAKDGVTNEQARAANEASAEADPNNPDKALVRLIDGVAPGGTLDGAFFDIEAPEVVDALARAAKRGVTVRLATETDYYTDSKGQLREPIRQLLAAGVLIKPDQRDSALMHDKFLVLNGQAVWTGSYNVTTGGAKAENNNALYLPSPELAGIYQREFDKMFVHGNFGLDTDNGTTADDHPTSTPVKVGAATVTPYFSPSRAAQAGAKGAVMAELAQAKRSVEFLAFSFTDDEMADLMASRAAAGVKVSGVFEKSQAASRYSEYHRLKAAAQASGSPIDVRLDTNPALMHHKVMIIDDSTLIMGSFNFSSSAQKDNDENMLVIKDAPELVARYKAEFARVQAAAAAP